MMEADVETSFQQATYRIGCNTNALHTNKHARKKNTQLEKSRRSSAIVVCVYIRLYVLYTHGWEREREREQSLQCDHSFKVSGGY